MNLHLISHYLCPYVQRAAISLMEKVVPFERTHIDLSTKPDWFLAISPLGKTPVLTVDGTPIFESAAILEYLEETQPHPLHPADPLKRAQHRAWMEFGSAVLNDIAGFYNSKDADTFTAKATILSKKFERIEAALGNYPYFNSNTFSLVDVVFGPVFRYFDVFDAIRDFGIITGKAKIERWRQTLAARPSIQRAVSDDYLERLRIFLKNRNSHLSTIMGKA